MFFRPLSAVLLGLCSLAALASSKICIDSEKNEINLEAHYYFYGDHATILAAKACVDEMNSMFNNGSMVRIDGKGSWNTFKVNVGFSLLSESDAIKRAAGNKSSKINFVRIDEPPKGSRIDISEHGLDSNSGYFIISNNLGKSTTCAHEFGHGLGLKHPDPCNWKGKGVPPLMAPRGCIVDKEFQYQVIGKESTINPFYRRLSGKEVSQIDIGDLPFETVSKTKKCVYQGKVQNLIYKKDGNFR